MTSSEISYTEAQSNLGVLLVGVGVASARAEAAPFAERLPKQRGNRLTWVRSITDKLSTI